MNRTPCQLLSALFASALAISGCASTSDYALLQSAGHLRVEPAESTAYDYRVSFRNVSDFGYDGDVRADREKALKQIMRTSCPASNILDETMIETGKTVFNVPIRTYVMKVKC